MPYLPNLCPLAFSLVALSACHAPSPTTPAVSRIDDDTSQILIEEYGDSTTVGYTSTPTGTIIAAANQPNTLQWLLRSEFGDRVVVKNEGVGGIQSSDALLGTDGRHSAWASLMKTSHAQIVTLNFGLNDAFFFSRPEQGKVSASPQEYQRVMRELVDIAVSNGKTVVLYEPNPSCHPARKDALPYYVTHLNQLSQEKNIPLVSQYWGFVSSPDWEKLLSDCTHPTPAMYRAKGENAYRVVGPLVGALIAPR